MILFISWEERQTNISFLEEANTDSNTTTIIKYQLRWTGHVILSRDSIQSSLLASMNLEDRTIIIMSWHVSHYSISYWLLSAQGQQGTNIAHYWKPVEHVQSVSSYSLKQAERLAPCSPKEDCWEKDWSLHNKYRKIYVITSYSTSNAINMQQCKTIIRPTCYTKIEMPLLMERWSLLSETTIWMFRLHNN